MTSLDFGPLVLGGNTFGWSSTREDTFAVLDDLAADHDVLPAAVALAWLRQQPTVAAPIAGARTPGQLPALLASFDLTLIDDELARLDRPGG